MLFLNKNNTFFKSCIVIDVRTLILLREVPYIANFSIPIASRSRTKCMSGSRTKKLV